MKVCGPKLSLCLMILSVWGIIQLTFMGIFYNVHSVALIEDLPLEHHYNSTEAFFNAANNAYKQNAQNCWIAACIYLITLVAAGLQFYANRNTAEY